MVRRPSQAEPRDYQWGFFRIHHSFHHLGRSLRAPPGVSGRAGTACGNAGGKTFPIPSRHLAPFIPRTVMLRRAGPECTKDHEEWLPPHRVSESPGLSTHSARLPILFVAQGPGVRTEKV